MTWEKAGKQPKTSYISNGVDRAIFHPTNDPASRPPKATASRQAMAAAMEKSIAEWDWKVRSQEYFALFRRLIDEHRASR